MRFLPFPKSPCLLNFTKPLYLMSGVFERFTGGFQAKWNVYQPTEGDEKLKGFLPVAFVPQRFIHAANVRLDVPVSVHLSEQLTDELRHSLEDATLTAFDCIVENCISHQVDFLLLSGNVFVEADRSLRARLALIKGCERLQNRNIAVFILPGDADPQEAWRAIPDLPKNVTVCYSSNPDPSTHERNGRVIATVTSSMWYGRTDSFGIQVIGSSGDGAEPFRIGTVSQTRFDESLRMASLTSGEDDELLRLATQSDNNDTTDDSQQPSEVDFETLEEYEAAFHAWIDRSMRDGRLNYAALVGELHRSTLEVESGIVHCPGTSQPRNQLEADCGLCSLVEVDAVGETTITEINTSAVDWKMIKLTVSPQQELNSLLESMRQELFEQSISPSDRMWSIRWTFTGPLPVLQGFLEEDLELAVAVELEEITFGDQTVRLVHEIRLIPDAWELPDPEELGQQYSIHLDDEVLNRPHLEAFIDNDATLSDGWKHRLKALAKSVDTERILGQLRTDGAEWFVADLNELIPEEEAEVATIVADDDSDQQEEMKVFDAEEDAVETVENIDEDESANEQDMSDD